MTTSAAVTFWEGKHRIYANKDWVAVTNDLAHQAVCALAANSYVLELGCGQGQDAVYLAQHGHHVVATDFSPFALTRFPETDNPLEIDRVQLDTSTLPYPFPDGVFDAVYAHLSLHYFSEAETQEIFGEIARVLRPGGALFALFNSIRDPECGTGTPLEPRYWELASGDRKRFFSADEIPSLLGTAYAVDCSEFGRGTRKNPDDEFVQLIAHTTVQEQQ